MHKDFMEHIFNMAGIFKVEGKVIKNLYISVDSTYIIISTKPLDDLSEVDFDNFDKGIYWAFDRCDGINYYKHFEDKQVVDAITKVIEDYHINCLNLHGDILTPTDED